MANVKVFADKQTDRQRDRLIDQNYIFSQWKTKIY